MTTDKITLPDFSKEKEKKAGRPPKYGTKKVLPRTNRWIKCAFCKTDRVLNPDQYQRQFDYHGSEDSILNHWKCQECVVAEQDNPFKFWFDRSDKLNIFAQALKKIFETYIVDKDGSKFQNSIIPLLDANHIKEPNYQLLTKDGLPEGLHINFPFVGNVVIKPLEYLLEKKITIVN